MSGRLLSALFTNGSLFHALYVARTQIALWQNSLSSLRNKWRNPVGTASSGRKTSSRRKKYRVDEVALLFRPGAAVVEFAIVAPIFFLFVLGIIEFGRMVMVQQVLTNASREGARVAVVDGATTEEVVARARAILNPAGIRTAQIVIDPNPPGVARAGAPVTVTVRVPFREVSWLPMPLFLGNITLQATTVMRRESV